MEELAKFFDEFAAFRRRGQAALLREVSEHDRRTGFNPRIRIYETIRLAKLYGTPKLIAL